MHNEALFSDLMRALVAVAVVTSTTLLGYWQILNASAASAILGGVIGYTGAQGAAAIGHTRPEHSSTTHT